jgi:hypothetical protein
MATYIDEATLKSYSGIDYAAALSAYVLVIIDSVTKYIENECGEPVFGARVFLKPDTDTSSARKFDGNGSGEIAVGDLVSVDSVTLDGIALVKDEDYLLYPLNAAALGRPYEQIQLIQPESRAAFNSRAAVASRYVFTEGQGNVVVTGKWRFSDAVPSDIKLAALKLAGAVLKERNDAAHKDIASETIGDYSVSYERLSQVAHSLGVSQILASYKRRVASRAVGTFTV